MVSGDVVTEAPAGVLADVTAEALAVVSVLVFWGVSAEKAGLTKIRLQKVIIIYFLIFVTMLSYYNHLSSPS